MKRLSFKQPLFLLACVTAFSSAAMAGPGLHSKGVPDRGNFSRCSERSSSLDALKVVLQLTPQQQSSWTAFADAMSKRPSVESMRTFSSAVSAHEAKLNGIKLFYASLSDSQKKVFDQEFWSTRGGKQRQHNKSHGDHHPFKPWM